MMARRGRKWDQQTIKRVATETRQVWVKFILTSNRWCFQPQKTILDLAQLYLLQVHLFLPPHTHTVDNFAGNHVPVCLSFTVTLTGFYMIWVFLWEFFFFYYHSLFPNHDSTLLLELFRADFPYFPQCWIRCWKLRFQPESDLTVWEFREIKLFTRSVEMWVWCELFRSCIFLSLVWEGILCYTTPWLIKVMQCYVFPCAERAWIARRLPSHCRRSYSLKDWIPFFFFSFIFNTKSNEMWLQHTYQHISIMNL